MNGEKKALQPLWHKQANGCGKSCFIVYTFQRVITPRETRRRKLGEEKHATRAADCDNLSNNSECQSAGSYRRADASKIRHNVAVVVVDGDFERSPA